MVFALILLRPSPDENAVLDGNFNVHGVNNLRVVDASSWPKVPGFFVTSPTYMVRSFRATFNSIFSLIYLSRYRRSDDLR